MEVVRLRRDTSLSGLGVAYVSCRPAVARQVQTACIFSAVVVRPCVTAYDPAMRLGTVLVEELVGPTLLPHGPQRRPTPTNKSVAARQLLVVTKAAVRPNTPNRRRQLLGRHRPQIKTSARKVVRPSSVPPPVPAPSSLLDAGAAVAASAASPLEVKWLPTPKAAASDVVRPCVATRPGVRRPCPANMPLTPTNDKELP